MGGHGGRGHGAAAQDGALGRQEQELPRLRPGGHRWGVDASSQEDWLLSSALLRSGGKAYFQCAWSEARGQRGGWVARFSLSLSQLSAVCVSPESGLRCVRVVVRSPL